MRDLDQHTITQEVVDRFAATPSARLKQVMTSLVTHLHDFARDVRLTEVEWEEAIAFLTATGQKCDDRRQEFILLSDVLGLSMLVVAMNNEKPAGCTEATVFGPFHVEGAPEHALGEDLANGATGLPLAVRGTVRGPGGEPVAGAVIDVWQADGAGFYDVQDEALVDSRGRGVIRTDAAGAFHFRSVVPSAYPIPTDGPVGRLLDATRRHPWRPAHLHFRIRASGYESLTTHVFRDGDPWLDSDAVFGVRQSLVETWIERPDGGVVLEYHFVLAAARDDADAGPRASAEDGDDSTEH